MILAIDPGPEQSAWVLYDGALPVAAMKEDNAPLLTRVDNHSVNGAADVLVIEQVACMGMSVGAEVFETVFWSGRFAERFGMFARVKRHEVKMHLCGNMRAKDANIRQAIIDRYGGKDKAIGRKASPGPLYGISGDCWSALAIAIVWSDKHGGCP